MAGFNTTENQIARQTGSQVFKSCLNGITPVDEVQRDRHQLEVDSNLQQSAERDEGYFKPAIGHIISGGSSDYTVVSGEPLGVGVFSVVWPCADKNNKLIALKVVRKQPHFRRYAESEVQILTDLKRLAPEDEEGSFNVLNIREHFMYGDYLCMAFEKLQANLRTIGKQPLSKVIAFTKQMLLGLRFLHDVGGLAHCDVKPDNLLLRYDGKAVKLCDFGTARPPVDLQTMDELQPLFYRAPEVFIGAPRGRKIDIWSAGCTIYELVVGRVFFRSCNTPREVLERIMQFCGPLPHTSRKQGRHTQVYFSNRGFHPEVGDPVDLDNYKKKSMMSELAPFANLGRTTGVTEQDQAKAQLSRLIGRTTVVSAAMKRSSSITYSEKRLQELSMLVESCLDVDPASRSTAAQAVQYSMFLNVNLPSAIDLQEAPPLPKAPPPPLPSD